MPNNQDAVKLPLPRGYFIKVHEEVWAEVYHPKDDVVPFLCGNYRRFPPSDYRAFAAAMNTPTPREQELEARVTALLAVLDEVAERLAYAAGRPYTDCVVTVRQQIDAIKKAREVVG
jgi:hypothetical protein